MMNDHGDRSAAESFDHRRAIRRRIAEGATFTVSAVAGELGIPTGRARFLLAAHVQSGELRAVPSFGHHVDYEPRPRP